MKYKKYKVYSAYKKYSSLGSSLKACNRTLYKAVKRRRCVSKCNNCSSDFVDIIMLYVSFVLIIVKKESLANKPKFNIILQNLNSVTIRSISGQKGIIPIQKYRRN